MKKSNFVKIDLTYNYPEEVDDYSVGSFGEAIVYLNDPEIYIITTETESDHIEDYLVNIIIPKLKKYYGEGPYTLENIVSQDIEESLTRQYEEDCRTAHAFVTMEGDYVDWDDEDEIINVSEKLESLQIPGVSFITLLKKMDKK